MPDIVVAQEFQQKMTVIESAYLKQIAEYRRDTRRALLDITERSGVSRTAVGAMQREIDDLSKRVAKLAKGTSADIQTTIADYTRKQIEFAEKVGLVDSVDIAPILRRGESIVKDAEISYMTNQSAWLSQLESSLQLQSAKLRIGRATPDEITNRLLSETKAGGRSSVWATAGVAEEREETGNIWGMAGGIVTAYLALFNEQEEGAQYSRQIIATIDERTTQTCLELHGTIVSMDENFVLSPHTPRFADEVFETPFHWYAIVAGEMCFTDKGNIPIENIKIGDMVLTHKNRYKPVTMTLARKYTGAVLLIETDHGEIKITPEHPVLTVRGWVKAGKLLNGDVILGLKQVEKLSNIIPALDNVSGNAEFFSNAPLGISGAVLLDNKPDVNTIVSLWHNNLLYGYYTVKSVNALVLKNVIICDLSVQDDESYCIADHFVHNCRSTVILYAPEFESIGISTDTMIEAAQAELKAREDGSRQVIYPSSATSRRS